MSLLLSDAWLQNVLDFSIVGLLALGLYVCMIAGQFSLGHAALAAAGGYTAALLSIHTAVPFAGGLVAGAIAGALLGVVMAVLIALRLKDFYLAIGTLAAQFAVIVAINNTDQLGGPLGLIGVSLAANADIALGLLIVGAAIVWWIERARLGRALRAIHEDEAMAAASGISVWRTKVAAWAIGGAFAGVAGALTVHTFALARPDQFGFHQSLEMLVPVIVGGTAVLAGPLLGAAIVTLIPYAIDRVWEIDHLYISGTLLILVMLFRPAGLLQGGEGRRLLARLRGVGARPAIETALDGASSPIAKEPADVAHRR